MFYENPLLNFLQKIKCKLKCCKESKFQTKIGKVKRLLSIISDKLDLKKILIQIHNFDLNLKFVLKKLNLEILYEDEFNIMEKWKNEYQSILQATEPTTKVIE